MGQQRTGTIPKIYFLRSKTAQYQEISNESLALRNLLLETINWSTRAAHLPKVWSWHSCIPSTGIMTGTPESNTALAVRVFVLLCRDVREISAAQYGGCQSFSLTCSTQSHTNVTCHHVLDESKSWHARCIDMRYAGFLLLP